MDEHRRSVASDLLIDITGQPVRSFFTRDFGREQVSSGVSAIVPEAKAELFLIQLRKQLPPSLIAFIGTRDRRAGGVELVIGPGTSQFDILRLAQTDAINYNLVTEDLIARLHSFDQQYGITLLQAETDIVVFDFDEVPDNILAFARELYAFCPDIVDQGVGSVEALADGIEVTGRVLLWWD